MRQCMVRKNTKTLLYLRQSDERCACEVVAIALSLDGRPEGHRVTEDKDLPNMCYHFSKYAEG